MDESVCELLRVLTAKTRDGKLAWSIENNRCESAIGDLRMDVSLEIVGPPLGYMYHFNLYQSQTRVVIINGLNFMCYIGELRDLYNAAKESPGTVNRADAVAYTMKVLEAL